MKTIFGIVGEKFAGKDVAANFLVEKRGAYHVRFSQIFDEILNILDIPVSRKNEIAIGNGIRSVFGEGVFVPALVKRIKASNNSLIVVNGIRLLEEFEAIKALGAKIIYITAPAEIRFERYKTRKEKADDGAQNYEDFLAVEKTHTEKFIGSLGLKADCKIENTGSLEDLYGNIKAIL